MNSIELAKLHTRDENASITNLRSKSFPPEEYDDRYTAQSQRKPTNIYSYWVSDYLISYLTLDELKSKTTLTDEAYNFVIEWLGGFLNVGSDVDYNTLIPALTSLGIPIPPGADIDTIIKAVLGFMGVLYNKPITTATYNEELAIMIEFKYSKFANGLIPYCHHLELYCYDYKTGTKTRFKNISLDF